MFTLPVAAGALTAIPLDHTAVDGSQKFFGILAEAVTTGGGETQLSAAYITGEFHSQALVFGGSTTLADVIEDMRNAGCYVKTSDSDENLSGGA